MTNNFIFSKFLSKGSQNQDSKQNKGKKISASPTINNTRVQILGTLVATILILIFIALFENSFKPAKSSTSSETANQSKAEVKNDKQEKKDEDTRCEYKYWFSQIICLIERSKLLSQVQNFGVLSAALLFFCDTFNRRRQLELQASQLIDGAQGCKNSLGRRRAIEDYYKEDKKNLLTGLGADKADLTGINLSGANLTGASFKNAILKQADFKEAILENVDFTGAYLENADFRGAELHYAKLIKTDLTNAKFQGAKLQNSSFDEAILDETEFGEYHQEYTKLNNASFRKAIFFPTSLKDIDISGAFFGDAKTGEDELEINIISNANNYGKAKFSQKFINEHSTEYPLLKLVDDVKINKPITSITNDTELKELLDNLLENCYPGNIELRNKIISIKNRLKKLDDEFEKQRLWVDAERKKLNQEQEETDRETQQFLENS